MKKVAIIGGGITGCVAALYLTKQKCNIDVYEKSNLLGGILKDFSIDNKIFFPGPQYIDSADWVDFLYNHEGFDKVLKKIEYVFGSYTDLFDEDCIISDCYAHPITKKRFKNVKKQEGDNLFKRFKCYQENINVPLINWCNKFGNNLKKLHNDCHFAMQVGRIYFSKDESKINQIKNRSITADNILGIPNKIKYKTAYVPKHSYDEFFLLLKKYLQKKGVTFHHKEIVRIKEKEGKIYFGKNMINSDYFIWSSNPVPLINYSRIGKLDNLTAKMITHFFEIKLDSKLKKDAYYQIFSKSKNINRIYLYGIKNSVKLNVECFYVKKDKKEKYLKKDILDLLKKFGYSIKNLKYEGYKKELRHIFFTINDNNIFKKFAKKKKFKNFVPGSWEIYGRQKKIDKINFEINRRIFGDK